MRATEVEAAFAFARPEDVSADENSPPLLRARSLDLGVPVDASTHDLRRCRVRDCGADPVVTPSLDEHGFAHLDIGHVKSVQAALARIRSGGRVGAGDARAIRRGLRRARLRLADGRRVRILYVAPEGFIMRQTGPDGMRVNARGEPDAMNDHTAARAVHIDQDVDGTPVRQILRGAAPRLFHHRSPLHANERSPLHLLNLWIPLQQVTAPLALVDGRTVDRPRHQLRFGLPTDELFDRPPDRRVNDIWTLLHDESQRWYFTADMDMTRAYLFETLSTPHGAFVLPGEAHAAELARRVMAARTHLLGGHIGAFRACGDELPMNHQPAVTRLLIAATARLEAVLGEVARGRPDDPRWGRAWRERADRVLDSVIRKSVEMRTVALITGRRP